MITGRLCADIHQHVRRTSFRLGPRPDEVLLQWCRNRRASCAALMVIMLTYRQTITKNVPTAAGNVIANVWSNGDPGWTNGPPTSDAPATIQYIKMYFNSTSLSQSQFNSQCSAAGNPAKCHI